MSQRKNEDERLDSLINGKLPSHVVDAINKIELKLEDAIEWQKSRRPVSISIEKGRIHIECNLDISVKKALALITGITGIIWAILVLIFDYLPAIRDWLS